MSTLTKPRFHDEECFGDAANIDSVEAVPQGGSVEPKSSTELISSARDHFLNNDIETAVSDLVSSYEAIERDRADLAELRNKVLKALSNSTGWQSPPHPQALRLRRLTPLIPVSQRKGRI